MKKLILSYSLSFLFHSPVVTSHFRFMGIPSSKVENVVSSWYSITPKTWVSKEYDVFGNNILYGSFFGETKELTFNMEVKVEKREGERKLTPLDPLYLYSSPSSMTKMGPRLSEFKHSLKERKGETNLKRALYIMDALSLSFVYQKGVTNTSTSAEEAFKGGKGVCQDYSQIMLALLRDEGIPSRYCCGVFMDAKESHAWIEVLSEGVWIGLDPANSKLIDDTYMIMALGQDSMDTQLNKGIFLGGERQEMKTEYQMVAQ